MTPGGSTIIAVIPLDPVIENLLRELTPSVVGAVVRRFGDFAAAEDAVQEALLDATTQWPKEGLPDNPRAWLIHGALAGGAVVALTSRVDDVARATTAPELQKHPGVLRRAALPRGGRPDRDVCSRLSAPFQAQYVPSLRLTHRPASRFGQEWSARSIEQVVHGFPSNLLSRCLRDRRRLTTPERCLRIVEEVASVEVRESPEQSGGIRQHRSAIGSRDRMDIRTSPGPGVLRENRLTIASSEDGDGSGPRILTSCQASGCRRPGACLIGVPQFQRCTPQRYRAGEDPDDESEAWIEVHGQ